MSRPTCTSCECSVGQEYVTLDMPPGSSNTVTLCDVCWRLYRLGFLVRTDDGKGLQKRG